MTTMGTTLQSSADLTEPRAVFGMFGTTASSVPILCFGGEATGESPICKHDATNSAAIIQQAAAPG